MAVDSRVTGRIEIIGGPQAIAQLKAYRAELTSIAGAKAQTTLGVDSSALTRAKGDVASLGSAHQALAAKPAKLGMDITDITNARSAVKGLDGDVLSLVGSLAKLSAPAALAGIGVGVTKLASDFQTLSTNIQNNTTASGADIAGMNTLIKQLSVDSGASLQSLAGGWTHAFNIMGNGADAAKVLSVAMESAVSTGADVSATTDALAKTIHQFGGSAADAAKDMDILHLAAAMGNTTLEQFIGASAKSMVTAASLGVSLKDVSSAYVALTRSGFDAGEANTQIAALLTHLIKPSAEAQAAIKDLAKTTGIDLTNDFTLAGIQSKGLVGVLGDIRAATNGQEDAVLRLIPAQRGGIGALALTTSAYKDATEAGRQFNGVISGELTPTADAYARTQATLGNQAAVLGQQFKQLGLDLSASAVGPVTDLLKVMNAIPEGVKRVGVEIALTALAVKTASVAADLLATGATRLAGAIAGDTAAVIAETGAVGANTIALEGNAAARASLGGVAAGSAAVKTAVTVEAASVETAGAMATIAGALTTAASLAAPIIVGLTVGVAIAKVVEEPAANDLISRTAIDTIDKQSLLLKAVRGQTDRLDSDSQQQLEADKDIIMANLKNLFAQSQKEIEEYAQSPQNAALEKLGFVDPHKLQLQYQRDQAALALITANTRINPPELGPPIPGNLDTSPTPAAPPGLSDAEQKKHDEEVKQSAIDVANFQKYEIQSVADAQIAAAKASADAWKDAGSEVAKVDIGKAGLQSLIDAAPGLDRVQLALAQLGTGDQHLDNLTAIAKKFADIADAEKLASASYRGYLLTLDETDKRVTAIDALKKRLLDAVDAAQQAKLRGTDTANDRAVIAGAPGAFAQLNQAEVTLKGNGAQDWAGIIANLPEWLKGQLTADSSTRAAVGNGKELLLTVNAETTKAAQDLKKFEEEDRKAVIKITADTKDAVESISAFTKNIPTSIPLLITTPPGGLDPNRGIDGGSSGGSAGGYARPTIIRSTGGGPYGNDTLAQGGTGGASTATPRGDAAALIPYAAVIQKAADAYGVPAWMLGAIILHESGGVPGKVEVGGGLGRGLTQVDLGQHPDQYAHQAELTGTSPSDIAYQINKGAEILAGALKASGGNPQGYAGSAYRSQAGGGVPAGLDFGTELSTYYRQPVQAVLGGQSDGGGGAEVLPGVVSSVRQQIVNEALKSLDQTKLVNYCEQFVEETVQAITGKRGATGKNENTATEAFQHAAAMGLETKNPQPGDLVYYPDANGGPGHVAVYQGKGQQISTADRGGTAIHTESVGPGARYISIGQPAESPSSRAATNYGPGTYTSTGGVPGGAATSPPPSLQSLEDLARAVAHVDEKGAALKQTLATLTPKDFAATVAQFNTLGPILDKLAHKGDTAETTDTTKIQESAAALAKNLDLTQAWGQALNDIHLKNGNLAADEQKISDLIGGPMATALNRELESYNTEAQAADRIAQLTQRKADLEASHNQVLQDRQAQDTAESRAQTRQGYADQDADQAIARRQRTENTAYTGTQRTEEDRARQLQFSQQVQATGLQNKLTDLQKEQQSTVYQRTAQETLVGAQAKGAGTNSEAASLSARLAGMHEQDLAQKDLNTKAIDDIQLQIREQAKAANLESYNLETERIVAQRKHEDVLKGLEDEGVTNAANRQARDRAHQQELFDIEDARIAEDKRYTLAQTSIDKEIAAQQQLASDAADSLKAAQDALAVWEQTGIDIGTAGTALSDTAQKLVIAAQQAAYYSSVAGTKTDAGVPYSQFPAPGASHAAGGFVSGGGIVGDTAGGDMSSAEYVEGNYRVYSHADSVRMGKIVSGMPRYQAGTGGTGGDLHMHFNGGANALSDDDRRDIHAYVNAKIAAAERRLTYAGKNARNSRGG